MSIHNIRDSKWRSSLVDRTVLTYNHRMGRSKPHKAAVVGELPDRVAHARGFNHIHNSMRISKALGVKPGEKFSRKDAHAVFDQMDADGSGEVSYEELKKWILQTKIFKEASGQDLELKLKDLFNEIDKDGSGEMDFEEFYKFLEILERERKSLTWASKHYQTALPKSHEEMNEKLFTTDYIEKQLHRKIEAYTPSDMDRFRKVLILCRTQNAASREELGLGVPDGVSGVTKRDFRKLLSWLGLFATEKQAYELFDKYDVNGDGTLTVHEFLTQIRPPDFPGVSRGPARNYSENRGGKRMYKGGGPARGGTVEKPKTPHPDVMNYSVKDLAITIRTKLSGSGKVGQVYTDARGKRDLLKLFYFHDPTRSGMVTNKQFLNCMMMIGVNSLGQIHLEMIFNKFMVDPTAVNKAEIIDYIAFSEYVFPEWDKPPAYFKELTLDTRGKHYVQNPYDKTVELRTGRLSEAGSARLTSLSRPGSRSMTRSTSEAQLSGRTTKSGRRMQRSATSSNLRAQTPNEEQEFSFNLAPGESSLTKVKRMQVPSKNANPLLAAMPDHYYRLKSKNRNAIVL